MRLRHHVPNAAYRREAVAPEYQEHVDSDTRKAMVAYERAQRRLVAAEARQLRADGLLAAGGRKRGQLLREAEIAAELVELRREELQRIEALMKGVPASLEHRGRGMYRPVPQPGRQV